MIVAVKRKRNWAFLKLLVVLILIGSAGAYYYHIDKINKEKQKQETLKKEALKLQEEKKEYARKEAEKVVVSEVEKIVSLIGQEYIRQIKLIENKIVIVCEPETNLDALTVRYGVMAFIKKTLNEIVIAIDIDFILKNKLNEK